MAAWLCRSTVISVALPPKQAIELFTPEGERKWSAGWDPVYPRPERTAGPGAVFITGHDGHTTTWTMVDHTAGCVRYARVTPGVAAGTVTVALEADGAGGTRAQVTYDLTSLPAGGARGGGGRGRGGGPGRNWCASDIRPPEPLGRRRRAAGRFRSRLRRRHR